VGSADVLTFAIGYVRAGVPRVCAWCPVWPGKVVLERFGTEAPDAP
jgi:hypothetical protein